MTKELPKTNHDDTSNRDFDSVDTAFRKINKNATNFLIWKIENMNVAALPKDQYGIFHSTDSYIIYACSLKDQPCGSDTVTRATKGCLERHIHFWLGSETHPDKSGIAAYKTVELDNFLNNHATQHRETEGFETSRFLSYFQKGIKILNPESIDDYPLSKLYKLRGKIIKEMPRISWEFFTSSDIYLIKTPDIIFIWLGRASDTVDKVHAVAVAEDLTEKCKTTSLVFVDDGYEKTLKNHVKMEFDKYLPLEKRSVLPENREIRRKNPPAIKLYKCVETNAKYRVSEIKIGPINQQDLDCNDVYILDQDSRGVWVWVGRLANDKERREALRNARGFVKKKKYPACTRITRVVDGHEPQEFKTIFSRWKTENTVAKPSVSKYDAVAMENRPNMAAETQLIDDGTGSLTIWRVNRNEIIEIPKEKHGNFFSGDCYVVLYTYRINTERKHLLYCWLGAQAVQEEIDNATAKLTEIDEDLGRIGFRARLIQGRETSHFLQIFKGKLTIFKGRGIDFDESGRNLKQPSQYLLQVYGSSTYSCKAVQVSVKASTFNSNFCFVLKRSKKTFVWSGGYSTGDQREMAKGFAGPDFELILEGKEREDFFNLLGGKVPYSTQISKLDFDPKPARLFRCSYSNGEFRAEEIVFFKQRDLVPEHVMFLDTDASIYIWIGKLSSREERRLCAEWAIEYLQSDPAGRDLNISMIQIKQEQEPPTFIGFFPIWDKNHWTNYKTFSKIRQDIEMKSPNREGNAPANGSTNNEGESEFDRYEKYPLNILKEPNDKLPPRIDPLNKELHLTHDDFVSIFHMSYKDFEKLPRWKQQEMKKKAALF
ncbi:villin-like protein quail [Diorhabda carinulata]|uniref:villin-like protein quail n=1 Tax=Diorhabda carinulata TaxID=1163345 RepID=UPI0025A20ADF|nr:villin-like protein quail [Diorhabda carinulata]